MECKNYRKQIKKAIEYVKQQKNTEYAAYRAAYLCGWFNEYPEISEMLRFIYEAK